MRRLLIIKPSSLGDIVHGLQAVQTIKDHWPDAHITWVVRDRFAPLVEACETVDETLVFARRGGPLAFGRLLGEIRRRKFDIAIDMQGLLRSGLMLGAARARRKLSRRDGRELSGLFAREKPPLPPAGLDAHALAKLLEFLPLLDLPARTGSPVRFAATPPDHLDERLRGAQPIVLCPNSRGVAKEWPCFRELTAALVKEFPEDLVVWDSHQVWSDIGVADGPEAARVVNLTGKSGLLEMVGLIQGAKLVVANDSGPMHIAAALGTPVVALFGPTPPERFGPWPLDNPKNCALRAPNNQLHQLPVDNVLNAIKELLIR